MQDREKVKISIITEEEKDFVDDMADQIISLSKVCNKKHEFLLYAEKFIIISFILGLVLYVLD